MTSLLPVVAIERRAALSDGISGGGGGHAATTTVNRRKWQKTNAIHALRKCVSLLEQWWVDGGKVNERILFL